MENAQEGLLRQPLWTLGRDGDFGGQERDLLQDSVCAPAPGYPASSKYLVGAKL